MQKLTTVRHLVPLVLFQVLAIGLAGLDVFMVTSLLRQQPHWFVRLAISGFALSILSLIVAMSVRAWIIFREMQRGRSSREAQETTQELFRWTFRLVTAAMSFLLMLFLAGRMDLVS